MAGTALNTMISTMTMSELRRILNAATFVYDEVYLNANFAIDPTLDSEASKFLEEKINMLIDLGALKVWKAAANPMRASCLPLGCEQVIDDDAYIEMYELTNQNLVLLRKTFLGESFADFDGITEIINGKHVLFHAELAKHFGTVSLLHDTSTLSGYSEFISSLAPEVELADALSKRLVTEASFPDVTALPPETLQKARAHLNDFRQYLVGKVEAKTIVRSSDLNLQTVKDEIVPEIVEEYQRVRTAQSSIEKHWSSRYWQFFRVKGRAGQSVDSEREMRLLIELDR